MNFYLVKTEPQTYSIDQFKMDQQTHWNGVRNFQARGYLKAMKRGDQVLIYHSGKDKAIVGLGEVVGLPEPEPTQDDGEWVQVKLKFISKYKVPLKLSQIKADPDLKDLLLIKQSRLSVMPLKQNEFSKIGEYLDP